MTRQKTLSRGVTEQAAEAWETFHGADEASGSEHRDFDDWMRRSPEHVEAYLRVFRAMHTLRSQDIRWPDTPAETLIREAKSYIDRPVTTLREESPEQFGSPQRRFTRTRLTFALAATLFAAIAVAWFVMITPQTFETRFGEQRFVHLDDGSGVTLNTASRIEVELRKGHRFIRLVRGEALFEVAHDPARPFDVYTGKTILRAVGTRFNVDMRADRTTVTVLEGVVSLTHGAGEALPLGNTPLLRASDRVLIDSSGPRRPEHNVRLDEVTAWTQQKLVFKARPLGEVVEEFNRYNRERILVDSAGLRSERITGVFKASDPASLLSFLSNVPGVHIRQDGNAGYVVTLDDPSEARP